MENKIKKTTTKKMISECKAAFKKICDSNKFDKTFFDQAFGEFENKVNFLLSNSIDIKKDNHSKMTGCIINTGSSGSSGSTGVITFLNTDNNLNLSSSLPTDYLFYGVNYDEYNIKFNFKNFYPLSDKQFLEVYGNLYPVTVIDNQNLTISYTSLKLILSSNKSYSLKILSDSIIISLNCEYGIILRNKFFF